MSNAILLVITLAAALGGNIAKKHYADKKGAALSAAFVFNAGSCFIAALILPIWGGVSSASWFTVLLGLAFGVVTALQGITNLLALRCGPLSYTTVVISFSTLIPSLSGILFFGEELKWAQIVGIVLMAISFLAAVEPDGDDKRLNLKWIILSSIAFIATGAIGVMQKVHQSSAYSGEINVFLLVAFASSAIICAVFGVVCKKREGSLCEIGDKPKTDRKTFWILVVCVILSGVFVAVNNKLNLYLSGVMESAMFFPIVNGGGLVLTTLAALIIFREKLTKKKISGILVGIVSVVFLCNPFS